MLHTKLVDNFGRRIDYLRVSVTDRCDLRCAYCLPDQFNKFEEPTHWLNHLEIIRLVRIFTELGVSKIRLTGGEPLLRRGIVDLAKGINKLPSVADISLSSNGTQLARHAASLKAAGVNRLNISLDSLDPTCFTRITGRNCLQDVMDGLSAAKAAGFSPIKINMVVLDGHNVDEIEAMVRFALREKFLLRLIEPMPIGATGQKTHAVDLTSIGMEMAAKFGLHPEILPHSNGPARYWIDPVTGIGIGVITPLSQHFCATCNRIRLTVNGTLLLCLGQEDKIELGPLLRNGASDTEIKAAILDGIANKPERHHFIEEPQKIIRFMAQTGG